MKNPGLNYKYIITEAEKYNRFTREVEEIKEMMKNKFNCKNNILELKENIEEAKEEGIEPKYYNVK